MVKVPSALEMPRKFNCHVVLDLRVGTTYNYPDAKTGPHALLKHLEVMGPDELFRHPDEERESVLNFITEATVGLITGGRPPQTGPGEVIVVGPYACLGGTTEMKNIDFVAKRYADLVNGSPVGEEDYQLHAWLIGKWADSETHYAKKRESEKAGWEKVAEAAAKMGL